MGNWSQRGKGQAGGVSEVIGGKVRDEGAQVDQSDLRNRRENLVYVVYLVGRHLFQERVLSVR